MISRERERAREKRRERERGRLWNRKIEGKRQIYRDCRKHARKRCGNRKCPRSMSSEKMSREPVIRDEYTLLLHFCRKSARWECLYHKTCAYPISRRICMKFTRIEIAPVKLLNFPLHSMESVDEKCPEDMSAERNLLRCPCRVMYLPRKHTQRGVHVWAVIVHRYLSMYLSICLHICTSTLHLVVPVHFSIYPSLDTQIARKHCEFHHLTRRLHEQSASRKPN